MRNLLTHPPRLPLIAPSILSADFARMGEECRHVLEAGADLLHLDVMDGHFVPNLTMGPDLCRCLRRALPGAFLDVHLMVTDPGKFAQPFLDAGANHITFHAEVLAIEAGLALAERIREGGATAGVAFNPATPSEAAEPYLGSVDLVLVMSVNPGFSGQSFKPEVLAKVQQLEPEVAPTQRIQMDGGLNLQNIGAVLDAGVDVVVAASAIFGVPADERASVIRGLRQRDA